MESSTIAKFFQVRKDAEKEIESLFMALNEEVLNADDDAYLMPGEISMDEGRYSIEFELTYRLKVELEEAEKALLEDESEKEEDLDEDDDEQIDEILDEDEDEEDDEASELPKDYVGECSCSNYVDFWIGVVIWLPQGETTPQASISMSLDSETAPYVTCWKKLKELKAHYKGRFLLTEDEELWGVNAIEIYREPLSDVSAKTLSAELLKFAEGICEEEVFW